MKSSLFRSQHCQQAFLTFSQLFAFLIVISAPSIHAAEKSTEIDTLRRSIAALNAALGRYETINAADNDSRDLQKDIRFREHLQEEISLSCRKLYNLGGSEALAELNCPDERVLGVYLDKQNYQTGKEAVSELDGALLDALGDFDDMLLKEEERIERKKAQTGNGVDGGGTGSSGGGVAGKGAKGGQPGSGTSDSTNTEGKPSTSAEGTAQTGGDATQTSQIPGSEGALSGGKGGKPSSEAADGAGGHTTAAGGAEPMPTLDSRDDDIVARQLREAAEKEVNPELKRKLWEEYYRYKGIDNKSSKGRDTDDDTP